MSEKLLKAMDAAAVALLKRVEVGDSVPADREGRDVASISESVKVFEAVGEYAKWRSRLKAEEPEKPPAAPSKFEQLREAFNDDAAPAGRAGRGRRPRSTAADGGGSAGADAEPDAA